MHKRKLTGILKYGKRKYKVKKFESGGSTASSGIYNWREDPYEQQLANAKLQRQKGTSKSSSSSSSKMPNRTFTPITGGLEASMASANQKYNMLKNSYYNEVKKNGIDWASGAEGQQAYQQVLTVGTQLQNQVKSEKEQFDEFKKDLSTEDKGTLAIANNKAFVLIKNVGDDGKETWKEGIVDMDSYYKDMDKYRIKTLGDFMSWKRNRDPNMNTAAMEEFMGNGALSQSTIYDTYIKDKVSDIGLETLPGKNMFALSDGTTQNKDNIKNYLMDLASGGDGTAGLPATFIETSSNTGKLNTLVQDIYTKVRQQVPESSRIFSSMEAEVLSDKNNIARLKAMTTKEEKDAFMNKQMKLTLANRILFNEKIKSKVKKTPGAGGEGPTGRDKTKLGYSDTSTLGFVTSGEGYKQFAFGSSTDDGRNSEFVAPGIQEGAAKVSDLGVHGDIKASKEPEKARQNTYANNTWIQDNLYINDVYVGDGEKLTDIIDAEQGAGTGKQVLNQEILLKPNEPVDLVFLPTVDGKPAVKLMQKLYQPKLKMREAFIKSYNANYGKQLTIKPNELAPNNTDPEKIKAYEAYVQWVGNIGNIDSYKKAIKKGGTPDQLALYKKRLKMAEDARAAMTKSYKDVQRITGGRNIIMKKFAKVVGVVNEDSGWFGPGHGVPDAINKSVGRDIVKQDPSVNEYVDNMGRDAWNFTSDKNYSFDMYIPMKGSAARAADSGEGIDRAMHAQRISNAVDAVMNSKAALGGAGDDLDNLIQFFIQ